MLVGVFAIEDGGLLWVDVDLLTALPALKPSLKTIDKLNRLRYGF